LHCLRDITTLFYSARNCLLPREVLHLWKGSLNIQTRCVFWFMCKHIVDNTYYIYQTYGSLKGFKQQKWLFRSFKVTDNDIIWYATYDSLLVFISQHTKFDVSSFTDFKDTQCQRYDCSLKTQTNGSRDLTTHLSEMICHHGLILARIKIPIKLEVSNSTHYEDMKGDTKCGKWGGYRHS